MIVSTLAIRGVGNRLRSTTDEALDGTIRRPSRRTRVRVDPRPRSCTLAWPARFGLLEAALPKAVNCGNSLIKLSMLTDPVAWKSSWVTVTIGLLAM